MMEASTQTRTAATPLGEQINQQRQLLWHLNSKVATVDGICLKFKKASEEHVRRAYSDNIGSLLKLLRSLEPQLAEMARQEQA